MGSLGLLPACRESGWNHHAVGDSGAHSGINKTPSKVRERFYWVRCREDVESWCKKCTTTTSVRISKKLQWT